jgi:hypothetical protein
MVQTIFTNLTADRGRRYFSNGGLRSAVRRQEIVKSRFQRSANRAELQKYGDLFQWFFADLGNLGILGRVADNQQ